MDFISLKTYPVSAAARKLYETYISMFYIVIQSQNMLDKTDNKNTLQNNTYFCIGYFIILRESFLESPLNRGD